MKTLLSPLGMMAVLETAVSVAYNTRTSTPNGCFIPKSKYNEKCIRVKRKVLHHN